jgi:4-hydroxy-tetrahydrodipicolinate synthase
METIESKDLRGTFPALITPLYEIGKPEAFLTNEVVLHGLIYHVLSGGSEGVVLAGCTGHAASLTINEQVNLIASGKDAVEEYNSEHGTNKLVIGGDGSNSTREAIGFAREVEKKAGVNTHLMISPYVNKPSQRGIISHYNEVAKNIEGRIILYSVPGRTGGTGIESETAVELAYNPKIIGIKEASGDPGRIKKTISETKKRGLEFVVVSGDDALNIDMIYWGATGSISVAANVDPIRTSSSVRKALGGSYEVARKLDRELKPLYEALFLKDDGNPVMAHYALREMGFQVGVPRLPLVDASPENKEKMNKVLVGLDLLK